jgi:hypothetical protein
MIFAMRASQTIPWTQMISRATVLANWATRELCITLPRMRKSVAINVGTRTTNHGYLRRMRANLCTNATNAFIPTGVTGKFVFGCHG